MADPLAGAVLAPIGNVGADPLAGAQLAPLDAPNLVQRLAGRAMGAIDKAENTFGGELAESLPGVKMATNVAKMAISPFMQHTDPTGQGRPLPMGVGALEDIGGGIAQGYGATVGAAAGPFGAMAGAGAGAAADDILNAKINQQLYGWGYQPSIKGLAGTAAIAAATEGLPRVSPALQQRALTRNLTKQATEAGEEGVASLYKKDLPEAKAQYEKAVPEERAKMQAAVEAAKTNARGEVAKSMVPKAAQVELENMIGQQPQAPAGMNPELYLARRNAAVAKTTVWDPKNRLAEEYGRQYEIAAPKEVLDRPAGDLKSVQGAIDQELTTMHEKGMGQPSARVMKLVNSIQQTGDSDWGVVAAVEGSKEANRLLKGDPAALEQRAALNRRVLEQMREKGIASPMPTLSNADLLNFSRIATSLVGKEDGPSSVAASKIRDALLGKLSETGVNIPPDLNMQYGRYKKVFDDSFIREVGSATHPEEYAGAIFKSAVPGKPSDRFDMLFRRADPGEKIALKNLFRDWAYSVGPEGLTKLIEERKLSPSVPRALFGDSAYGKLEPWLTSDTKALRWEQVLSRVSPAMRQQMIEDARKSMADGIREATEKASKSIAGTGKDIARKLGPAGNGLMAQLRGSDPVQAARVTQQVLGKALGDVPEIMPEPGTAEMAQYRKSKAIAKGVDINERRQEAAIAKLAQMGKSGDPVTKKALQKLQWYGPLLIALSATGTISPYLLAAGSFAALEAMLFSPRRAMLKALETDEGASLFYKAISSSPNSLNAKLYAQTMGKAAAKNWVKETLKRVPQGALAQQAAYELGLSAGVPPEDKGEGE